MTISSTTPSSWRADHQRDHHRGAGPDGDRLLQRPQLSGDRGGEWLWSVFVPGRDFLGLSDGDYTITATVSDKAGNPGSTTHNVTLNGDVPTIAINTFAQDDIVNAAEHGTPLVISGTTDAPTGQTVTITLNGKPTRLPFKMTAPELYGRQRRRDRAGGRRFVRD